MVEGVCQQRGPGHFFSAGVSAIYSIGSIVKTVKILFIGDVVGRPGRRALRELLPGLIGELSPDLVVANGENAAGGFGITPEVADELKGREVDVITSGNHIWDRREIMDYLLNDQRLIRPVNYPPGAPGYGWTVVETSRGYRIGVVNLEGRVFMNAIDCPFRAAREAVERIRKDTHLVVVDFHAETTSEKAAMGFYLDGTATAVIGTHTHVQTSDERVLAGGTAFITDAGMTGPIESVIGMRKDEVVEKFLSALPVRFEVAKRGVELQGVVVTADAGSGRAVSIERIKRPLGD